MLFDVRQFEQFFKETTLKKGLTLFEKGRLEYVSRAGQEYTFLAAQEELVLKKRGDKVLSYTCSCGKASYCEHLAAALFYFQQGALGIHVKDKISLNKNRASSNKTKQANKRKHAVRTLRGESYFTKLQVLLEPYLERKKLDEHQIKDLVRALTALITKLKKQATEKRESLYLELAIVRAFMPVFQLRFSGDERPLFELQQQTFDHLEKLVAKGLTAAQKTEWQNTLLISLESNKQLQSGAFFFLIPRYLQLVKSADELLVLKTGLEKRSYKTTYARQFNTLAIVRAELALTEKKLSGTALPPMVQEQEAELIIAQAELYLCKESEKAFAWLEANYEKIKRLHRNYYNDYLSYIISAARKYHQPEIELKYLHESFIHRLFIQSEALERFLELVPHGEQKSAVKKLIGEIKDHNSAYYFDKLSLLFLRANLLDELIAELAKQHGKFHLIHEVALKKFPDHPQRFLELYIRHLAETLKQNAVYPYQVQLFTKAKAYLDKLPEKTTALLVKELLIQVGKTGHFYRYVQDQYRDVFAEEY